MRTGYSFAVALILLLERFVYEVADLLSQFGARADTGGYDDTDSLLSLDHRPSWGGPPDRRPPAILAAS